MTARRPVRSSPVTQPAKPVTTNRLFQTSTGSWYARWKARAAESNAPSAPEPDKDEAAEALAQWLKGGAA